MNKVLFLDRDGVVNVDYGHVYQKENFKFVNGIFDLCKLYKSKGYMIIIVTNQAGIAKGMYTEKELADLHSYMLDEFEKEDVYIDDIFYCPHHPDYNCACRKPKPGLFFKANNRYGCDFKNSLMIGDKITDLIAANNVGIKKLFLLKSDYEKEEVTFDYKEIYSLNEIVELG